MSSRALAHRMPDELIAEFCQRIALRRMPGALDELHDANAMAAAEHSQRQPERGRRLALAGAGMNDEQTLLDRLFRDFGILHGFALRHLGAMPLGFVFIEHFRHERVPFTASGSPATTSTTRSARAAMRWLSRPCKSRKRRPSG